jgi:hypothetical protein
MTTATTSIDAARVELMLTELRLPGIKAVWARIAEQSDKEGWPAARFLAALAEHEMVDRGRRRIERHLAEARLPAGKTLATFDFDAVPMVSKAQVMALAAGDVWLNKGANILLFGPRRAGGALRSDVAARAICRRRSGSPSSKTVGAFCSPAPPISCSGYRWRGASWPWKVPSPSSIVTTC